MTRRIKAKPQIKKREAMQLAQQVESDPLGVLQTIAEREPNTYFTITHYAACAWTCSLSFSEAMYDAKGRGETLGDAVKQAILRAYDTGAEKDWQLREKSFQGGGE